MLENLLNKLKGSHHAQQKMSVFTLENMYTVEKIPGARHKIYVLQCYKFFCFLLKD